jgi:voltage-gated potassium channel Kch
MFVLLALLAVAGAAAIAHAVWLSPSLGAFMAGVLLADSEYRHEVQADIEPFEGVLLGFFFISVGMSADLALLRAEPGLIALAVAGLLIAKSVLGIGLGLAFRQKLADALRFGLALPQGSEFSFVLFGAAMSVGAMQAGQAQAATLVVALSMAATPLLFAASETLLIPRLKQPVVEHFDAIENGGAQVILLGFGRVGQIVARILRMNAIRFTALERDPAQLEAVRRFGNKVYYGDPGRPDLLRAAGADTAKLLVVALDDMEEVLRVVDIVRRNFPGLPILARARNRRHVHLLLDRAVDGIVRDTFHSSLKLAEMALTKLGVPAQRAQRVVAVFAAHDEKTLLETHAFYSDERQVLQNAQQWGAELAGLLEADTAGEVRTPEKP